MRIKKSIIAFVAISLAHSVLIARQDLSIKWRFTAHGWIGVSPAVDSSGTIYFGSWDNHFYAINPDGSLKWKYQAGGVIRAAPAIDGQGNFYFGCEDNYFYSLQSDGTLNWRLRLGAIVRNSPAIGEDNTIYVSAEKLYAIDSQGNVKWTADATSTEAAAPVIGHDGTLYLASNGITAVGPDNGYIKWQTAFPPTPSQNSAGGTPALGADGTIYVGSKDYHCYAFNPDGTLKWRYKTGSWVLTSPVIMQDGTICFGSNDFSLYFINPNGTLKHKIDLYRHGGRAVPFQFCLGQDNMLYVCASQMLFKISPDGRITDQITVDVNTESSPAISSDGTVYFGTLPGAHDSESYLYAVQSNSGGLANTHWPKYSSDNHNSGNKYNANSPVAKTTTTHVQCDLETTITLDGTPTQNPAKIPLTFLWKCTKKPANSDVTILDSTNIVAKATLTARGVYEFQLQVRSGSFPPSVTRITVFCGYKELITHDRVSGSPAIDENGNIYIGSTDNHLYAFEADGTEKWRFLAGRDVYTPVIGPDGTIYFGSEDQTLYAVDPDGTQKWMFVGKSAFLDPPAIDAYQIIYTNSGDELFAINPDGSLKWRFQLESDSPTAPIVGTDGTIYFNSRKAILYALNSNGSIKWQANHGSNASIAIGTSNELLFAAGNWLRAVNPDGSLRWQYGDGYALTKTSPVVGNDGVIYVSSAANFNAIQPDGTVKWQYSLVADNLPGEASSAAIDLDGNIYFTTRFGEKLYTFTKEGELAWTYLELGSYLETAPALAHGWLYLENGFPSKQLIGLQIESSALASSIWPKSRLNNRNTASVHNPKSPKAVVAQDTIEIDFGEVAILDGSLSTDPDNDSLTFFWRLVEKPAQGSGIISDSTSAQTEAVLSGPGTYRFSLTVSDNEDGANVAFVTVHYALKRLIDIGNGLTSLAIDSDQSFYVGSAYQGLFAFHPDGSEKWHYRIYAEHITTPTIGDDGTIYVTMRDSLFSFDKDGNVRWSLHVGEVENASPAIGRDGMIYVGTKFNNSLFAFTPDGIQKWQFRAGGWIYSSPAIAHDGTIYFGSMDGKLYAINPDGKRLWTFATTDRISASPAIGTDGTIYIGSYDKNLYAINPDSTEKWRFAAEGLIVSSAVVGYDESIYFCSRDDRFYGLNADGSLRWAFEFDVYLQPATPLIAADSTIYIGSYDEKFYALNPDGSIKWTFDLLGAVEQSAGLNPAGMLLIPTQMGFLYAIQTPSYGLATSAWPKIQSDPRNSGQVAATSTAIDDWNPIAEGDIKDFRLFYNYPNPFNNRTIIKFQLPKASYVKITIYDLTGKKVVSLFDGHKSEGRYQVSWSGIDSKMQPVASGIYYCELLAGEFRQINKLALLR